MNILRGIKDLSYNPIEIKVRNATKNDSQRATTEELDDLAAITYNYRYYPIFFKMLWKRLCDLKNVTHVDKALAVIEHIIDICHTRFKPDCLKYIKDINNLTKYKYYNKDGIDVSEDIRMRARKLICMLETPSKSRNEDTLLNDTERIKPLPVCRNKENPSIDKQKTKDETLPNKNCNDIKKQRHINKDNSGNESDTQKQAKGSENGNKKSDNIFSL